MKTPKGKALCYTIAALFIFVLSFVFSFEAQADEYRYERYCNGEICIVYVYNSDGALVNVYEELDNGG